MVRFSSMDANLRIVQWISRAVGSGQSGQATFIRSD